MMFEIFMWLTVIGTILAILVGLSVIVETGPHPTLTKKERAVKVGFEIAWLFFVLYVWDKV